MIICIFKMQKGKECWGNMVNNKTKKKNTKIIFIRSTISLFCALLIKREYISKITDNLLVDFILYVIVYYAFECLFSCLIKLFSYVMKLVVKRRNKIN